MADPEALKAIEEKKNQLKANLRDIIERGGLLQTELARLRTEGIRVKAMLEALEKDFPEPEVVIGV